jgi:signal peptidase I
LSIGPAILAHGVLPPPPVSGQYNEDVTMNRKKMRRYSYSDQKSLKHWKRWVGLGVFVFFVFYFTFTTFVFSTHVLQSDTMMPNLRSGDRFIVSSFAIHDLIPSMERDYQTLSLRRGDVVLVDAYMGERPGLFHRALYGVVRFFTAQQVGISGPGGVRSSDYMFVRRVIGLPGDEVSIEDDIVRVRTRGTAFSLTEFEVTERTYTTNPPNMPHLWDTSMPFFGNMDAIVLGDNEVFLLSDDRMSVNDSRTWGSIPLRNIRGQALFRYWPPTRIGRP